MEEEIDKTSGIENLNEVISDTTEVEKPKRQKCIWVTLCFILLFAAVIVLFVLHFTSKSSNVESPALKSMMENGETPMILTVNNDSIIANFVLVDILTKDLESETQRYQNELESKQSVFEEKYKNYQMNVQKQVLTQTQMQNAELQLTKEAENLKALQAKYSEIMSGKQISVQKEIVDSIVSVTKRINDTRYHAKYVFATSGGSALI